MAVKSSEVRSGIFVVLAVVALTILVFSVGNFRARLKSTTRYVTYVSNVKFLKSHDPVTYAGFKVGEIKNIEVAPERYGMVKITVGVDEDIPVKEDAALLVKQDGILGPKYLELSPGSQDAKRAGPDAILQGIVPTAFVELGPAFEGPLNKLTDLLDNLNKILGDAEFRKNVNALLTESRALLATMNTEVQKLGARTDTVLTEVNETVKSAREPLTKAIKNADELTVHLTRNADVLTEKLAKTLEELTARMSKTADNLDQLLKDSDAVIVQNNANLYETVRGLRDMTHHLERASKRIRADPSILLFGASETPEELRRNDETELRLKGRARRYDKEDPK